MGHNLPNNNIKILNTLQELWAYCLFCPVCQDIVRDVHVIVGPESNFKLSSYKKDNYLLHLKGYASIRDCKYRVKYVINGLDNSFKLDIEKPEYNQPSVDTASTPYFYFFLVSTCNICNASSAHSADLELDILRKNVLNIGVSTESIYLLKAKKKYHITLCYDSKQMIVSKCFEEDGQIIDDNKPFNFPLINLDFSEPKKIINKIQTLLVFS